ncbi:MAG: hypothetical protein ACRDYA_03080 [Egibacteraceae bacterium]
MSGNRPVRYCDCGTRLARDNPGTRCALCQQKARDLVLRPPEVPPGFWDTDRMRDAFANWHMGQVIRAYRHHSFHDRPLSQQLVGGWVGLTQAQMSRIEHGPPVTDLRRLVSWAQTLRVPARCLWFDLPGQRRGASPLEAVSADAQASVAALMPAGQFGGSGIFADGDVMMVWLAVTIDGRPAWVPVRLPRRKVLAAGGASLAGVLAGFLGPDEFARVKAAVVTPIRADLATVGHLDALLGHYRRLDDQVGPGRLLAPVQSTLGLVEHLRRDARPDVGQALLSLSAQYEQLTGWLFQDSGDRAIAERAFDRAIDQATEAGDHAFARYVRVWKSHLVVVDGRFDVALELAQAAQAGEGRLTPAVQAYAAMFEARAWALDRKPDACKRKLDESALLLAESTANGRVGEPPWIYHFVEEVLAAQRGACLTDLGEAGAAIEAFDRALPLLPAEQVRDRAYHLIWSAKAHAINDEPEQAGVAGQEAAHIAIGTGSGRILEKLHGLHAQLATAGKDVGAVRELGELLRSASAPPGS